MPQPPLSLPEIVKEPIGFDSNYKLESEEPVNIRDTIFATHWGNDVLGIKRLPLEERQRLAFNVPDGWDNARLTEEILLLKKELEYIKQRQNSRIKIYQMEDLKRYER